MSRNFPPARKGLVSASFFAEQKASADCLSLVPWTIACIALFAAGLVSGCSGNPTTLQVGPIAFTDANGNPQTTPPTSLNANSGTYLEVTLIDDTQNLGANWSVYCGSALPPGSPLPTGSTSDPSCGTFNPTHTNSGPVPQYATSASGYVTVYTAPAAPPKDGLVTIYASSTTDPSKYSSVTLSVVGLPIGIGFAPPPPTSLPISGTASLKAVLTNDYTAAGANWTVTCNASSCGSFSKTTTASGTATTYTAPSTVPNGGAVTVTATSIADSTKSVSATIAILPVMVGITPATVSITTGSTTPFNATVANDTSNAGVDWTLSCGAGGACGSITSHTASGAAATYTAPSTVPGSGMVTVTATSTSDPTVSGTAMVTVTTAQSMAIHGLVQTGALPLRGATVSLYAAGRSGLASSSVAIRTSNPVTTDSNGNFSLQSEEGCEHPNDQVYLVAEGGEGRSEGASPRSFMTALGECDKFHNSASVVVNEVTTVASAYALNGFMTDAVHIGSTLPAIKALANSFVLAGELVDITTGRARSVTPDGQINVPQAEIDSLANILNFCATRMREEASLTCRGLFTGSTGTATDTLQVILAIAHNSTLSAYSILPSIDIYSLSLENGPFQPSLATAPETWSIALQSSLRNAGDIQKINVDADGNLWLEAAADFIPITHDGRVALDGIAGSPEKSAMLRSYSSAEAVDGGGRTWHISSENAPVSILAVDNSGDLWIVDPETGRFSEFVGSASPFSDLPAPSADTGETTQP